MIMLVAVTGWPDRSVIVPKMYEAPQGLIGEGWYVTSAVYGYLERMGLAVGEGLGVTVFVRVGAGVIVGRCVSVGPGVLGIKGVDVSVGMPGAVGVHVGGRLCTVGVAVGSWTARTGVGPANGPASVGKEQSRVTQARQ